MTFKLVVLLENDDVEVDKNEKRMFSEAYQNLVCISIIKSMLINSYI